MPKNRFIHFFGLLVLLVPITFGAVWGAFHSRPNFLWLKIFTKDGNRYVLGKHYLKHDSVLTCVNVATEECRSVRIPRPTRTYRHEIGFDGQTLWHTEGNSEQEQQLYLVSVPDLTIISKSAIEDANNPLEVCAVDSYIVRIQSDSVTVQSTENRIMTDTKTLGFSVDGLLRQIEGTQNVLVYESAKTFGVACDFVLLKIDAGKISQIARWQALDHRVMDQKSSRFIASLLPDGTTIETISALDGKVCFSNPIPDDVGLRLPLNTLKNGLTLNWNQWYHWDGGGMNLLTGDTMEVPKGFQCIWHDVNQKRLLCIRPFISEENELTVLDSQTKGLLFRFYLPVPYYHADDFQIDGDLLFLASRDGRVFFYDLSSGTLLRTIDPFRLVHWINCICGIAFLVWCVLWSKFSKGTHFHGLIDIFVYTLPVMAYVIMVFTHVRVQGPSEPTIVSVGIMLGLSVLASIWCAIRRPRWSMGVLPAILCVLVSLAFHSFTVGNAGVYAPMFIWAVVCTTIAASCFVLLLRSSSIKFYCIDSASQGTEKMTPGQMTTGQKRSVFPLRDLFLWTACFGIFFAMLKNDLCIVWLDWSTLVIAIPLGFFIAVIGTLARYLAMYCTDLIANRVARLSCALAVLSVFFADPAGRMVLPIHTLAVFENFWFPFYMMPVWLTVYLGLYAFRLRGWRIRLIPVASETASAGNELARQELRAPE